MKKLINDPFDVVEEMVEGFVAAHDDAIKRVGRRALARIDAPTPGKVGIVIGGGSGHLPAFAGYLGQGGADAVPLGNIFASPPAKPIVEATRAANGGAGVLYAYGNYAGDVINFDRAAEQCRALGIPVETVLVTDDAASAPASDIEKRRGVAGGFFVYKIAAAKSETLAPLDQVVAATRKANANTRTMGVGLTSCTVPANGRPTFSLPPDEMEIGLGIHGEPGMRRVKLLPVDQVVEEMMDVLLQDLDFAGSDVAVLINGLGGTPYEELYVVYRKVKQMLDDQRITVRRKHVGEAVTSLEMAGMSISLMRLDGELHDLLNTPSNTVMYRH